MLASCPAAVRRSHWSQPVRSRPTGTQPPVVSSFKFAGLIFSVAMDFPTKACHTWRSVTLSSKNGLQTLIWPSCWKLAERFCLENAFLKLNFKPKWVNVNITINTTGNVICVRHTLCLCVSLVCLPLSLSHTHTVCRQNRTKFFQLFCFVFFAFSIWFSRICCFWSSFGSFWVSTFVFFLV